MNRWGPVGIGPQIGPGQPGPPGVLHNPDNTNPFPAPQNAPIGCWSDTGMQLQWAAGTSPVIRTAFWRSPMFDLRPELRGAMAVAPTGVQSIYRGGGGQLFVFIDFRSTPLLIANLAVESFEEAHPWNPVGIGIITSPQDMSEILPAGASDTKNSAIAAFTPPGSGYPIRYWRVSIRFNVMATQADPTITVAAGYY